MDYSRGAAYLDGKYMPVAEAKIPVTDWAYRRSDVTYDVVGVWEGSFFALEDHLRRFRASMNALHMDPGVSDDEIRAILTRLVRLSGLRNAYVAMDCLRESPKGDSPRHPAYGRAYLSCFAIPWVWVAPLEQIERGLHLMIPNVRRIPSECVDPTVKNFHWGDLTKALFEAKEFGADQPILLDPEGHVTEGPGFNVFVVRDGAVSTPDHGVLEGITRKAVIELCEELGIGIQVRKVTPEELSDADEIFICTTAGGVMPASRINGRIMGNDRPGPISMRIKDHYWAKRKAGWKSTPIDYEAVD